MPVAIIAGAEDAVIAPEAHSVRLQANWPRARWPCSRTPANMVHHAALDTVVGLIEQDLGNEASNAANVSPSPEEPAIATPS